MRIALLCLLLTLQPQEGEVWHETDWSRHLASEMQGVPEYRLPDNSRVDIVTEATAWEVEWSDKWPEAIGQALFYSISTDKEPGVILLLRGKNAEEDYLECLSVVAALRQHMTFRFRTINTEK